MIIDEEIEVRINASNVKHYKIKGYQIPERSDRGKNRFDKSGTYLKVRSADVPIGSSVKIRRQCVCCNEISSIQRAAYRETCTYCAKKRCNIGEKCKKANGYYDLCKCRESKLASSNFCVKCHHKNRIGSGSGPKKCNMCGIQFKNYAKKNLCGDCYNKNRPKGEKHHNFNPKLSDEDRRKHSHSQEFRNWALCVKKRDSFKCRVCNYDKGKILCSHHLDGWDKFPDKRFLVENGITLCRTCHMLFHKEHGYGENTKEQFEFWKISYRPIGKLIVQDT